PKGVGHASPSTTTARRETGAAATSEDQGTGSVEVHDTPPPHHPRARYGDAAVLDDRDDAATSDRQKTEHDDPHRRHRDIRKPTAGGGRRGRKGATAARGCHTVREVMVDGDGNAAFEEQRASVANGDVEVA